MGFIQQARDIGWLMRIQYGLLFRAGFLARQGPKKGDHSHCVLAGTIPPPFVRTYITNDHCISLLLPSLQLHRHGAGLRKPLGLDMNSLVWVNKCDVAPEQQFTDEFVHLKGSQIVVDAQQTLLVLGAQEIQRQENGIDAMLETRWYISMKTRTEKEKGKLSLRLANYAPVTVGHIHYSMKTLLQWLVEGPYRMPLECEILTAENSSSTIKLSK
ncbi:uncharacterized protein BCR38DRAFT_406917 [Pseudomassariella vexata]|uniref:Uncharacterized protein n=1 Tax=Pseudomassariella vexata TaxID=1141098 RepID=A0A1Y2ECM1_9PEZI|nr:uncharacterized protein BCR38DRAFT_406917 [Pseudomassariella vexata]ORY69044.1 hypothetical protein BCR38DRAFT_406917 [Pseudomassariella vexata]